MKIYVVETINDERVQCGCSLSKKIAKKKADELKKDNKGMWGICQEYWVTAYDVNEHEYTEFET